MQPCVKLWSTDQGNNFRKKKKLTSQCHRNRVRYFEQKKWTQDINNGKFTVNDALVIYL